MAFIRWNEATQIWEKAVNPDSPTTLFNHLPIADPTLPLDTANKQYVDARVATIPNIDNLVWTSVPFANLTFSASGSMTWSVDPGDVAYFKYVRLGKLLFIKGSIVATTIGGTPSSGLRVAVAGLTFGSNDSFGMAVVTDNGFSTQDIGQSIARVTGNFLEFKKRDSSNWVAVTNGAAVIFNLVVELA
jgi:hypothetical protein